MNARLASDDIGYDPWFNRLTSWWLSTGPRWPWSWLDGQEWYLRRLLPACGRGPLRLVLRRQPPRFRRPGRAGGHGLARPSLYGQGTRALTPRTRLYGLTADEWMHLAAEGEDSEVGPCCGNIAELRECLNAMATCQGDGEDWIMRKPVLDAYEAASEDGEHGLSDRSTFRLLHRVLDGIREAGQCPQEGQ